jgi:hypothetical protein
MNKLTKIVAFFVVGDRFLVTLFAVLLSVYGLETLNIYQAAGESMVHSASFPRVITFFGLILVVLFFIQRGTKDLELKDLKGRVISELVDLIPLWMAMVYVAFFEYLGFLTATFLYVTITMKYLGQKTWLGSAGFGLGLAVTIFAVFYYGLLGELPRGELIKLHEWLPFIEGIRSAITG